MFKLSYFCKHLFLPILAVVSLAYSCVLAVPAARVLILYDQGADKRQPALTDAKYLENLNGHFNTSVQVAPVNDYKPGMMEKNDVVFYITYEKKFTLPSAFKSDFYNNTKTFCWINHQIGTLDQQFLAGKFGFHFREYREDLGFNQVFYKKMIFPKGDDNVNIVAIDKPSMVSVEAFAINAKGARVPYILKSKNLWFVADSPFSYAAEKDRYIVFADLLHNILKEEHPESHTALVRIEDINPSSDPSSLLKIAKYLKSKNVPFSVGLVPVFIDVNEKTEVHLEDVPGLLSVLRKLPSLGGTIVLHGYTHQYHGNTTDDYEFWDDIADKPVRGDSVDSASYRIDRGLKECFESGLYPMFWETPHYFASRNTYLAVKKFFSITYERRGTMDHLGTDQFFPYIVKDIYGQTVIPENLGYIRGDKPDAQEILDAAKLNLAVRDGYASFFFHPFIDISILRKLVNGIKEMGYQFKDVKGYLPDVTAKDKAIICGNEDVRIETREKYISIKAFDYFGNEKSLKNIESNGLKPYTAKIQPPKGEYIVIKPEEALEPGLMGKIWRLAKTDLSYMRKIRDKKPGGKLNDVKEFVFIQPQNTPDSIEERNDLRSLKFSLSTAGIKPKDLMVKDLAAVDLRDFDIIVLPYAAAKNLKPDQIKIVKEAVSSGANLLIDGPTKLSEELGIELLEEPVSVKRIRDYQFSDVPLFWPRRMDVRPVYKSPDKDYGILCVEEETNQPIAVSGKYGKGGFIYLATYFDPETDRGYSRFPFLIEMLSTVFRYVPLAERKTAEMYFDPGMRQFISVEKLGKLWRKYGIHQIYAAGWHFYDKYSYDYDRLIKVCHQNGILVHCWLEPPMVSQKFWNKYPQWREKTATLADARDSWRYLMNVADPDCRKKVFEETEALLMKYDWDGVNVSELYFESGSGPARPASFTPMGNTVRSEFGKLSGFDPLELFNPRSPHFWSSNKSDWKKFAAYRSDLCSNLKTYYLDFLAGIKAKKKDFEIVMTVIDSSMAPELEEYLAEDMTKILAMQKKYGLTLQVEDPSMFWGGKPERYEDIGSHYRKFVTDKGKLELDCNVLDNHKMGFGGLPAEKPAGEEIRQIVYNMSLSDSRPVFYSEQTIYENDFQNILNVLARDAVITQETDSQWKISSPYMVTIKTGQKNLMAKLDGETWFAGEGESIIVPAGDHILKFDTEKRYFDMASLMPRLHYISGELKGAAFQSNAVEFTYSEDASACYAIVNKRPGKIYIDNERVSCPVYEGDGGFSVRLPGGTHTAKITIGGGFSYLVETSGVVLFSIIIIFGSVTSILFLGLFLVIQIKRKLKI